MIHGATLLLLKYKLPYILHDPRRIGHAQDVMVV